jgi:hypothetical protein
VFENRVLRRMIGLERDEVTGECTKLRNGELRDLSSSANRRKVRGRTCHICGRQGNAYEFLARKPRLRHTQKGNIKMELRVVGWRYGLAERRDQQPVLVNTASNLLVTQNVVNILNG